MPRKKTKGNGQGSVYPRKNKERKIVGYLGAYYSPDGKRCRYDAQCQSPAWVESKRNEKR